MTITLGSQVLRGGSGGGGVSLPTAVEVGESIVSTGPGTVYRAELGRLPDSLRDAVAWLDFARLADVSAGVACGAWPSLQGGVATLYDGTPPTRSTSGAGGLDFSAAGGLLRVEGAVKAATAPFTVAVLCTPGPTGSKQWLAHWGAHAGLLVNPAGQLRFEGGGDLASGVTPADTLVAVATWDGSTKKIFVDGTQVASAGASISAAPVPFAIGSRGDGLVEPFAGVLHAAGCWARALSSGEVTELVAWLQARIA